MLVAVVEALVHLGAMRNAGAQRLMLVAVVTSHAPSQHHHQHHHQRQPHHDVSDSDVSTERLNVMLVTMLLELK